MNMSEALRKFMASVRESFDAMEEDLTRNGDKEYDKEACASSICLLMKGITHDAGKYCNAMQLGVPDLRRADAVIDAQLQDESDHLKH